MKPLIFNDEQPRLLEDDMRKTPKCELCGEPMPEGEEMFKYHGYSGDCPKPPLPKNETPRTDAENTYTIHGITHISVHFARQLERELTASRREIEGLREYAASRDADVQSLHDKFMHEYERAESVEARNADLVNLIGQFDAAIRRVATELTGKACGGVDTGDNINPETGEPYGHGGHTGWLLAEEAKKLKAELTTCQGKAEAFDNIMKSTYLRQAILNSYKGDVTLGKDIPAIIKKMFWRKQDERI